MIDYVFQFRASGGNTAQQVAVQFFKDLGQWQEASVDHAGNAVPAGPILSGELEGRHASWFMNIIGAVPGQTGLWLRLRWNGPIPPAVRAAVIGAVVDGVTIYPPRKFLPDGVTDDPAYTQPEIGVLL